MMFLAQERWHNTYITLNIYLYVISGKKRCGFQHDIPTEFNLVCTCLNTLGFLPEPVVNLINCHLHVSLIIVYNELITCRLSSFVRSHGRATLQLI